LRAFDGQAILLVLDTWDAGAVKSFRLICHYSAPYTGL
jgi:hypothetical protein